MRGIELYAQLLCRDRFCVLNDTLDGDEEAAQRH
jgi:hypothetical protein